MASDERPTTLEKVQAVERLMDEFDKAHAALSGAVGVLQERRERGTSRPVGPLFPFTGEQVYQHIEKARGALWDARKVVAVQYLDESRALDKELS